MVSLNDLEELSRAIFMCGYNVRLGRNEEDRKYYRILLPSTSPTAILLC